MPLPLLVPVLAAQAPAPAPNPVAAAYTKQELMVPMRDGTKLYTAVYVPKAPGPHPILLQRTPYGAWPYGPERMKRSVGPSALFLDKGYIVAYQDVRGRFRSEGSFVDARPPDGPVTEATDTYDTIDWLLKHLPDTNGKVGLWGISYPGFYTAQGMLCGHPALKAASPQAPMVDMWEGDDVYHHGAFQLAMNLDFFLFFRTRAGGPSDALPKPTPAPAQDGYRWFLHAGPVAGLAAQAFEGPEPVWEEYLQHPARDAYWQARDLRPRLKAVAPAVLTVGGWYDAEDLFGALACDRALRAQSPGTELHLVMGPWTHGQWADGDGSRVGLADFGQRTSAWYQAEVELPFFESHLKDGPPAPIPAATAFETGADRWRTFDAWPPRATRPRSLYLRAAGRLAFEPPRDGEAAEDRFTSDPAKPVPYTQAVSFGYSRDYMTEDQRFAASRPDVLVYETEPLEADLTVAGPLRPVLQVATSGTDADWVVKLIDVYPEDAPDPSSAPAGWHAAGWQRLVRGDVLRGRYRDDAAAPRPFVPGRPTPVAFTMPDVLHTFRKGHRIMVQVQCSWFPMVDRNPQTYVDIPRAKPSDFRPALQEVFHSPALPSRLEVGVLE